jgi:hypothetical protein
LNITGNGGFDIDAKTGTALGLYAVNGNPTLFTVDLSTGAARPLAQYAANSAYSGLAIPTQPVAYATTANSFYIFDLTAPTAGITKPITGLAPGEDVVGIDFRPANGQLYALARTSAFTDPALYTINAATAAATLVGRLTGATELRVGNAGFDFDPVTDRIRIIAGRRNVRVNPADATFIDDNDMCSENCPRSGVFDDLIAATAYDNNYAGATTSTLYAIIPRRARPAVVVRPNEGYYTTGDAIIAPGDLTYENGFDIGGMSNKGYAILSSGQFNIGNFLYTLDLPSFRYTQRVVFPFRATGFTVGLGF